LPSRRKGIKKKDQRGRDKEKSQPGRGGLGKGGGRNNPGGDLTNKGLEWQEGVTGAQSAGAGKERENCHREKKKKESTT